MPSPAAAATPPRRSALVGAVTVAVLVFLAGGSGLAFYWLQDTGRTAARAEPQSPTPAGPTVLPGPAPVAPFSGPALVVEQPSAAQVERKAPVPAPRRAPAQAPARAPVRAPARPAAVPSREQLAVRVNHAIDRGVAYLRTLRPGQGYPRDEGLLGLTLLECGVPATDPSVRRLADLVRQRAKTLRKTYSLALAIFFLERLNNPYDHERIRSLALRLAAGQSVGGDWGYDCPVLNDEDEQRFRLFLSGGGAPTFLSMCFPEPRSRAPVLVRPAAPSLAGLNRGTRGPVGLQAIARGPLRVPSAPRSSIGRARPRPASAAPTIRTNWGQPAGTKVWGHRDNSNTQFALLALWMARRHGVPVQPALARVARHFRATQAGDGSWSYQSRPRSRPSNTCAGLMGLAVSLPAAAPGANPLGEDGAMRRALDYLGQTIDRAASARLPAWRISGVECVGDLYFFWSLERMAMIYGLRVVGKTEWYPWAAECIVAAQKPDGSWGSGFPGPVDTCFALLVLRRTNLVPDLTARLHGRIRGQEPLRPLRPVIAKPQRRAPEGLTTKKPAAPPTPGPRGELSGGVVEKAK
jgi:hypothetical protein